MTEYVSERFATSRFDETLIADTHVELIRLDLSADGDDERQQAILTDLMAGQDAGRCTVLYSDDLIAVVRWHDELVIQITPRGMEMAAPLLELMGTPPETDGGYHE